jgi:hypothetical protein
LGAALLRKVCRDNRSGRLFSFLVDALSPLSPFKEILMGYASYHENIVDRQIESEQFRFAAGVGPVGKSEVISDILLACLQRLCDLLAGIDDPSMEEISAIEADMELLAADVDAFACERSSLPIPQQKVRFEQLHLLHHSIEDRSTLHRKMDKCGMLAAELCQVRSCSPSDLTKLDDAAWAAIDHADKVVQKWALARDRMGSYRSLADAVRLTLLVLQGSIAMEERFGPQPETLGRHRMTRKRKPR